jgi:hypothetical protein
MHFRTAEYTDAKTIRKIVGYKIHENYDPFSKASLSNFRLQRQSCNVILTLFLIAGKRHGHSHAGITRGIHRDHLAGLLATKVHGRQVCRQECDGHGVGLHEGRFWHRI